jgi:hypothetical protein
MIDRSNENGSPLNSDSIFLQKITADFVYSLRRKDEKNTIDFIYSRDELNKA